MMSPVTLTLIVLAPVLVWRVYTRLKTQMSRQRSIMSRHYTGVLVFAAMLLVPATEVADVLPAASLSAGALAGIALGFYGLRTTRFENTSEGYFFTPNYWLGMAAAFALVARILYIGLELYLNKGTGIPAPHFTESWLTMLCVGLTGGYFAAYSAGLLRWRRALRKAIDTI